MLFGKPSKTLNYQGFCELLRRIFIDYQVINKFFQNIVNNCYWRVC